MKKSMDRSASFAGAGTSVPFYKIEAPALKRGITLSLMVPEGASDKLKDNL